MCAFDELPRENCFGPGFRRALLQPIRDNDPRNTSLRLAEQMQGDVWIETGDGPKTGLVLKEVEESGDAVAPAKDDSESGAVFSSSQPDKAFAAHLMFLMSNANLWSECSLEEPHTCGPDRESQTSSPGLLEMQTQESKSVIECPGQKRVFPPAPDNNPFKKRRSDRSLSSPLGGGFPTSSELVGTLFGKPSAEISASLSAETASTSSLGCMQVADASGRQSTAVTCDSQKSSQASVSVGHVQTGSALQNPSLEPPKTGNVPNADADLFRCLNAGLNEEERHGRKASRISSLGEEQACRRAVMEAGCSNAEGEVAKPVQEFGSYNKTGSGELKGCALKKTAQSPLSSRSKQNKMLSSAGCLNPGLLKFFHRVATL